MAVKVFKESEVRAAILKKAPIEEKSGKRSPHKTAWLIHKNKKLSHFRIPNAHKKEFWEGKGNDLAKKLCLTHEQYNRFVECNLKSEEYLTILDKF